MIALFGSDPGNGAALAFGVSGTKYHSFYF